MSYKNEKRTMFLLLLIFLGLNLIGSFLVGVSTESLSAVGISFFLSYLWTGFCIGVVIEINNLKLFFLIILFWAPCMLSEKLINWVHKKSM